MAALKRLQGLFQAVLNFPVALETVRKAINCSFSPKYLQQRQNVGYNTMEMQMTDQSAQLLSNALCRVSIKNYQYIKPGNTLNLY